jgi:hypothetical protein
MSAEERVKIEFLKNVKTGCRRIALTVGVTLALALAAAPAGSAETGYIVGLNTYPMREAPQFSDPAVARITVGEKVTILEKQSGWFRIRAGEKSGWMPESVVGLEAPAVIQVGPLRRKAEEMEGNLTRLVRENNTLKDENEKLLSRVTALGEDVEGYREKVAGARNYQRLSTIALGGGLVIFGWVAGFALASASRRKAGKTKYRLD